VLVAATSGASGEAPFPVDEPLGPSLAARVATGQDERPKTPPVSLGDGTVDQTGRGALARASFGIGLPRFCHLDTSSL
jgi:hypothetical protein